MANVSIGPAESGNSLSFAIVSSSATGIAAIAGITGQIIRVYKLFLVVGGATNLTFQNGSTNLSGALPMTTNGSIVLDMDGQAWFQTSQGNAFNINNSGNLQVSGTVYYTAQQF